MSIWRTLPIFLALSIASCDWPSNIANDIVNDAIYGGSPDYWNCIRQRPNFGDIRERCGQEVDPVRQAARAEQLRQAENQYILANEMREQQISARLRDEIARGYSRLAFQDIILDARQLAGRGSKISIVGVYIPSGDLELLFRTDDDAIQFWSRQPTFGQPLHLLTSNASRQFRAQLLEWRGNPASAYGQSVRVLGTMTMCMSYGPFGNRRELPCLSVDEGNFGEPVPLH